LFSIEHEVRAIKPIVKINKNKTFFIQLSPFYFDARALKKLEIPVSELAFYQYFSNNSMNFLYFFLTIVNRIPNRLPET